MRHQPLALWGLGSSPRFWVSVRGGPVSGWAVPLRLRRPWSRGQYVFLKAQMVSPSGFPGHGSHCGSSALPGGVEVATDSVQAVGSREALTCGR